MSSRAPAARRRSPALARADGVRAADGPYEIAQVSVRSRPSNRGLTLAGVGAQPPRIDRPKLTDGRWLSGAPGEVVLDRTYARDAGLHVGQRLTVAAAATRSRADRRRDRGLAPGATARG